MASLLWSALVWSSAASGQVPALKEEASRRIDAFGDRQPGLRLRTIERRQERLLIGLELPKDAPLQPPPDSVENLFEELVGLVEALVPEAQAIELMVAHPGEPLVAPKAHVPSIEGPRRPAPQAPSLSPSRSEAPKLLFEVRPSVERFPFGQALSGRTVAISPGHGYIFYSSLGRYETQRPNLKWPGCGSCRGLTEDFGTHALAVRYLIPLLEGAGARVILVRERDENEEVDIVDDGDPRFRAAGSIEAGSAAGGHNGDYLFTTDPGAEIEWRLRATSSGPSWLSLWFVSGANRLPNASLTLETPTGDILAFELNQSVAGRRWVPIARIDANPGDQLVLRTSRPLEASSDQVLIADAARMGAGRHPSGQPYWRMGAKPFALLQDAPATIRALGDVTIRPRYAEWYGADAYLSLHSNATGRPNSDTSGTLTYRYSCRAVEDHRSDPDPSLCDDPPGSDALQAAVHEALVQSLRQRWDPAWTDRGPKAANFGEVRELDGIPGVLVESAFHDNVVKASPSHRMTDNQALMDPRWRRAAAWGLYRGLTRFLSGGGAPLLAAPPERLVAQRLGPGRVRLTFNPSPTARGYRVEISEGGRIFRPGPVVLGSPAVLDDLKPDPVLGLRLRALNEAGEGLPSRVVAARAGQERSSILIVDAFEREDAWVQQEDNPGDTVLTHGLALEPSHSFDSAAESALESGAVSPDGYEVLVVTLGRESTEHGVLTASLRAQLRDFVGAGGALYVGGTELGWALDARGTDESRAFLREVLGTRFAADDAAVRRVRGIGLLAGPFGTQERPLSQEGRGRVQAFFTDVLNPEPGYEPALAYGLGEGAAAIAGSRTLAVGFSLEHLADAEDQRALLGGWTSLMLGGTAAVRDVGPRGTDAGRADAGVGADLGRTLYQDSGPADRGASIDAALSPDTGISLKTLRRLNNTEHPVSGGLSCSASELRQPKTPGIWFGLFAGLLLVRLRRRTRPRIDGTAEAGRAVGPSKYWQSRRNKPVVGLRPVDQPVGSRTQERP